MSHVLIIDDEEETLEVFQLFLELSGYDVTTSANSEDAIQLAEQQHPDCLLLDVMMPGIDGFSLCRMMRHNPATASLPILFCTAYSPAEVEVRSKEAGGDMVISKPFGMDILIKNITEVISLRRQKNETTLPIPTAKIDTPAAKKGRLAIKETSVCNVTVVLDPNAPADSFLDAVKQLITGDK